MPNEKSFEGRVLDAMVANTEALAHLNASISSHSRDYSDGRKAARESSNTLSAKVDNLDRSVSEMKLAAENAENARQAELKRIYDLFGEERADRRSAVTEGRDGMKSEQDFIRQIIKEELGERRDHRVASRHMLVMVGTAIWAKGGQYIVLALCLLIVAAVMKATGLSLVDFFGIMRRAP